MNSLKDLDTIISETIDLNDLGFLVTEQSGDKNVNAFLTQEETVDVSNPNIVSVQEYRAKQQTETFSFNQPIPEKDDATNRKSTDSNEPEYINQRIYIDKFNEKVVRVELTPSVCRICGFDVAAKRHGRWGLVPKEERNIVEQALAAHKREVHTLGDLHIVKKSELPKQWLGSNSF